MNRIDLAGRRAVITGGAQGIGRAIAERFLASGAAVSIWDRNHAVTESTVQELSGQGAIHGFAVDVTDAAVSLGQTRSAGTIRRKRGAKSSTSI